MKRLGNWFLSCHIKSLKDIKGKFNIIFIANVLGGIEAKELSSISNFIYRSLKNKGILLLNENTSEANMPKKEILKEWASRNDWFGQDNIKTAAALAIDAELKSEGYDPTDNDFYQEIDKRINKAFSQNIEETTERVQDNTSPPAQVVSGSSRSSSSSSSKVKLSKEDVRLAQKWNIPLEQYAAEKLKVDGADGNYTNIT